MITKHKRAYAAPKGKREGGIIASAKDFHEVLRKRATT
jgi:hypothetical protein|tara:strand:- start:311 stop:424 length:114 start_codon:yes stop_codon:yes gene_type:complete